MSKETLKQAAEKLFASTNHKELWGNPKGEFFTSKNTGKLSLKSDEVLTHFTRPEEKEEAGTTDKPINHLEAIAAIKAAVSLEELKPFEADQRKSVKAAYDEKHAQLLAAIPVNTTPLGGTDGDGNPE